jgi:hypothetical protein
MPTLPADRRPSSRRWQFSLFTLLVAMTCVGLGCVALSSPSELWTGLVFVLAVGSLLVAGLCIVYRDGRARAFAVGFVIFGTAYFLVSQGDTPDVPVAHTQLPTTRWGIALYLLLHGEQNVQTIQAVGPLLPAPWPATPVPATSLSPPRSGTTIEQVVMASPVPDSAPSDLSTVYGTPANVPVFLPPPVTTYVARTTMQPGVPLSSFLSVVHYLLILALGVLGGIVAQLLHSTRRQQRSDAMAGTTQTDLSS